jgi:hypothetical protein
MTDACTKNVELVAMPNKEAETKTKAKKNCKIKYTRRKVPNTSRGPLDDVVECIALARCQSRML